MELTDEHLLGTIAGIQSSRTIYRLPKSHGFNKHALDRLVGTPTNPKPDCAAKDPVVSTSRRDRSTRTVSLLVVIAVKVEVRCHTLNETCRKRFDAIEKEEARETAGGGHEECGTATCEHS